MGVYVCIIYIYIYVTYYFIYGYEIQIPPSIGNPRKNKKQKQGKYI